jgi:hypothetical protein
VYSSRWWKRLFRNSIGADRPKDCNLVVEQLEERFLLSGSQFDFQLLQTESTINDSQRYLSVELNSSGAYQTGTQYFKTQGQPDTGVGYGQFAPGTYEISFQMRLVDAPTRLALWMHADNADSARVSLLRNKNVAAFSNTWFQFQYSLTVPTDTSATGAYFSITSSVDGSSDTSATIEIDNMQIDRIQNGTRQSITRGDLTFESSDFQLGQSPSTRYVTVNSSLRENFRVVQNYRWQNVAPWYEETRVQYHTRFGPVTFDGTPYSEYLLKNDDPNGIDPKTNYPFWHSPVDAAQMGATIWTRHVKSRFEGPHWRTQYPTELTPEDKIWQRLLEFNEADQNVADSFLSESQAQGLRTIAYYRMIGDNQLTAHAPYDTWFAKNPNGSLITVVGGSEESSGNMISMHSPYAEEIVRWRLLELAQKGFNGAYFDGSHGSANGDWSTWATASFNSLYGAMPTSRKLGDIQYRRLLRLQTDRLRDIFENFQSFVHADHPDFQFIVSAHRYPAMWSHSSSVDLVSSLQIAKTELNVGSAQINVFLNNFTEQALPAADYPSVALADEFGISLTRDTTNGRAPHVWIFNPANLNRYDENGAELNWEAGLSTNQLLAATASVVTYGGVANLHVDDEAPLILPDMRYAPAFNLNTQLAPLIADARPIKQIAIHVSELARDNLYDRLMTPQDNKTGLLEYWQTMMAPSLFSYEALKQAGLPATFVTDPQLSAHELDGYQALLLPTSDLTAEQQDAVAQFEARGGLVIRYDDPARATWNWHNVSQRGNTSAELLQTLAPVIEQLPVQIALPNGTKLKSNIFVKRESDGTDTLIVAVADDDSWLSDPNMSEAEKTNFSPGQIPAFNIKLRGIQASDVRGIKGLRYASQFEKWTTRWIPSSHLQATAGGLTLSVNKSTADPSKHMRLISISLNGTLDAIRGQ